MTTALTDNWPVVLTLAIFYAVIAGFLVWNDLTGLPDSGYAVDGEAPEHPARIVGRALAWPILFVALIVMALIIAVIG